MTRAVALLGTLAALLALVAASAGVGETGASGSGGVPPEVAAWAYAAAAVLALAGIPALLVLAVREVPEARRRGRRTWLTPLAIAAIAAIGVAASAYGGDGLSEVLARVRVMQPSPAAEERLARPPAADWVPLALASGLVLGGGALVLRRRPPTRRDAVSNELADALDGPLGDLRREADVRRAIVAAFARLELALAAVGAARAPGEAPFEYVERVLGSLDVPRPPLDALAALYERARFSAHPLGEDERDAAVDALETVRDALRVRP
ncbi:MAG TPA: DUF4129 domain-containing protein [Gaiellaceae bacterium]|nr:DUF4129 domain-containing protein [Gaiellaceae bacterium]